MEGKDGGEEQVGALLGRAGADGVKPPSCELPLFGAHTNPSVGAELSLFFFNLTSCPRRRQSQPRQKRSRNKLNVDKRSSRKMW